MHRLIVLTLLLTFFAFGANSQNLIGFSKNEIVKILKDRYPGWRLDATNANKDNGSIKITDADDEVTLIYFVDAEGKCKFIKYMLDNSQLRYTVDTLIKKHKKIGDLKWYSEVRDQPCNITVEKSEWYSTVFITKQK